MSFSATIIAQQNGDDVSQEERVTWLRSFEAYLQTSSSQLPREWLTTNFSRSSGPGGQNVNKLNTKAEVRLDLATASKEQRGLPTMSKEITRYLVSQSPYYVASSHALLISSMKTRTQSGNLQDALDKMRTHLLSLLSQDIRGETSDIQQAKVKSLIAKDKAKTRKSKDKRGSIKGERLFDWRAEDEKEYAETDIEEVIVEEESLSRNFTIRYEKYKALKKGNIHQLARERLPDI